MSTADTLLASEQDKESILDVLSGVHATWVLARRTGRWLLAAYSDSPSVAPTKPE